MTGSADFGFMKDTYGYAEKMATKGGKMVIYESQILGLTLKGPYLLGERQFVFWRVKLFSKQIEAKTLGHSLQYFNETETK